MEYNKVIDWLDKDDAEFIYSSLKIDNHSIDTKSRLRFWYQHARDNFNSIDGNIFEFGVFRGASLISMAILLKRLGSDKQIYAFDSFQGFPSYSDYDDFSYFDKLNLDKSLLKRISVLHEIRSSSDKQILDPSNVSASGNFSDTSKDAVLKKINYFGLDNINIIEGDFGETVPAFFQSYKKKIFSANLDCDLYDGYKTALPYIWDYLSIGGYVHLDEYYSLKFPGAKIACDEFCKLQNIQPLKQGSVPNSEYERWYLTK
tara:strand:- start:124 stop:900 length:777 start_codon:yes stop_codon:yes gene_type:complete